MIEYFLLILAIPLGILLAKTTHDEHPIYSKTIYFPTIKKILLLIAAISISQSEQILLTSLFTLITIQTWHKA